MEGAKRGVRGCFRRCLSSIVISLLLLGSSAGFPARAQTSYLIVHHFDRLTVYNRYQQIASRPELEALKPLSPVEVMKEDDQLGGGIIPCMTIQASGRTYYLVKDEDGSLSGSGDAEVVGLYRATTPLFDTVVVLADNRIRFSAATGSSVRKLSAGQSLFRFFEHKGKSYCQVLGETPGYGWVALREYDEGKEWGRLARPAASVGPLSEGTLQRIETRVHETNEALVGLYAFFNKESDEAIGTPQWELSAAPDSISIRLGGEGTANAFHESSVYLAKDIENMILGTGWKVVGSPGRILVHRR